MTVTCNRILTLTGHREYPVQALSLKGEEV